MSQTTKEKNVKVTLKNSQVIKECAAFLADHMSESNKSYLMKDANRRKITLEQMTAAYIIADFGIQDLTIDQLYKQ